MTTQLMIKSPTIIIVFLLIILPIGYTNAIEYSNFIYTETSNQDNLTKTQPRVLDIKHYQDGTAVLPNGSVIPKDFDGIQDINYYNPRNGDNPRRLDFGPSYLLPDTNIWSPNDYIAVNIDPRKGFLRLSALRGTNNFEWVQYKYIGKGRFDLLQNNTVENLNLTNLQVSVLPTLSYGYVIIYTNTTNRTLLENVGLYAIFLNYSQNKTSQPLVLHEESAQNIIFTKLTCSIDYINISYVCVLTIEQKNLAPINGTNNTSTITNTSYIKINFLSTGPWLKSYLTLNLTLTSFRALPVGGYAFISQNIALSSAVNFTFHLYDEYDKSSTWEFLQQPIISNLVSSYDILPNNTMLVAQNESTTAWNLLTINLPHLGPFNDSGYGNLHVKSAYPSKGSNNLTLNYDVIYIIYQEPVLLSDGNLTIYQLDDRINVRQTINSRTCQCNISGTTVKINIFSSTFNYPGGNYCIQIDNNFVKNAFGEPILGIQQNIWTFETATNESLENSNEDISGILRLTTEGTQYFQGLNDSEKHSFFYNLMHELTDIIPTEVGRLGTNERNQFDPADSTKILILFPIIGTNGSAKMSTDKIAKDLDQLIKNKAYTSISLGHNTKYLDETYGLGLHNMVRNTHCSHSSVARSKSPESENFTILQLGFNLFRFVTFTIFVVLYSPSIPILFIPSVVFLVAPIVFNFITAALMCFTASIELRIDLTLLLITWAPNDDFIIWFLKYRRVATLFILLSIIHIDALVMLKSCLVGLEHFNAPLPDKSSKIIFRGSCFSLLLTELPQFIIQVIYINFAVVYDIIPLLAIIASGLSILSNIVSKL
ncbi:1876_t:CDS:10 [Dentiscutata erythropus]|uniref:1876_t:CDS:1 n=1 Tax=Dentiscutata erythropus TaxID=1348616 RepID=A0A9N9F4B9_9GLOM|nr:1876_t:CDS:10 [Dentiscutata erythropus]